MDYFIAICGFLGAWLLVAGPLLQGALELREQELDRDKFDEVVHAVAQPEPLNRWWWLLPPVAFYRNQKRNSSYREEVMAALPPEQRKQSVVFLNKASGWFIVAGGAFLLATKETWELVETFDWHVAIFWVLLVVSLVLCVANVVARMTQTSKALGEEQKPRPKRGGGPERMP